MYVLIDVYCMAILEGFYVKNLFMVFLNGLQEGKPKNTDEPRTFPSYFCSAYLKYKPDQLVDMVHEGYIAIL